MSTLPGIIHITGEHDVGVTNMALGTGAPAKQIAFFDDDVKTQGAVEEMKEAGIELGAYYDLMTLGTKKKDLDFYKTVQAIIDGIKPGQFDVIIFDTWTRFARAMHAYVEANPGEFRVKYSKMGQIKGGQQWQDTHQLEAQTINQLKTLARTVILTAHLKDHRIGDKATGKQVPASSKMIDTVCNLRVWLRPNPDSPVPIALVLKRLDVKQEVEGEGIVVTSVLPRKMTPYPGDKSVWDVIRRYFANPIGMRAPTPEEMPDAYEISILEGTLTAEQRRTFDLMLKAGLLDEEPEEALDLEAIAERARELDGPPMKIATMLSEEFDTNVTVAQVVRWRRGDD